MPLRISVQRLDAPNHSDDDIGGLCYPTTKNRDFFPIIYAASSPLSKQQYLLDHKQMQTGKKAKREILPQRHNVGLATPNRTYTLGQPALHTKSPCND